MWIYGKEKLSKQLTEVLNEMWTTGKTPKWKKRIIFLIYKKGDKKKARNYRGITLLDTGYKIYRNYKEKVKETTKREKWVE